VARIGEEEGEQKPAPRAARASTRRSRKQTPPPAEPELEHVRSAAGRVEGVADHEAAAVEADLGAASTAREADLTPSLVVTDTPATGDDVPPPADESGAGVRPDAEE
jgi:hypothetical protein